MSEKYKNIILRFSIIFLIMSALYIVVIIRVLTLQTRDYEGLTNKAEQLLSREEKIEPLRGSIYDRNGNLLAGSIPEYTLTIDCMTEWSHKKIKPDEKKPGTWRDQHKGESDGVSAWSVYSDTIAAALSASIGDRSPEEYKALLTRLRNRKSQYYVLSTSLSYEQMKRLKGYSPIIRNKNKSGLTFNKKPGHRATPFHDMGRRTIGRYYNVQHPYGLENSYNHYLEGDTGIQIRDGQVPIVLKEQNDGADLITTLDVNMQDIAENMLRRQLVNLDANWGCAILMEVKTGEIRALVNLERTKNGYSEVQNRALQRVNPGSTFKTVSMMALMDDGRLNYERDTFVVRKAGWNYYGTTINDDGIHRLDTIWNCREAMAASSNIALAKMVTHGYKDSAQLFVKKLNKMHLNDEIPFELGGQAPLIKTPPAGDKQTFAKMSYGYYVELSPLYTTMFYNGIANGGKMVMPYLVKEIRQGDEVIERHSTKVINSKLCDRSTLRHIQDALHAVVNQQHQGKGFGTGARAQSEIVHIAGKTGTAQVWGRQIVQGLHRKSFVGYFPEEAPQYTCMVVIESVQGGSGHSAYTVRQIAERVMAYAGTIQSSSIALPKDSITPLAYKRSLPEADARGAVPNLIGLGAKEAVYAIERTGRLAVIQGKGKVVNVETKDNTVYLTLR